VGEKHYDLGNELYLAMLDKRLYLFLRLLEERLQPAALANRFTHQGTLQSNCSYS